MGAVKNAGVLCQALAAIFVFAATSAFSFATPADAASPDARARFHAARSWVYQLQGFMERLEANPADIAVVDETHLGFHGGAKRLAMKPDGSRRVVLSYLSIGEAESSRAYWKICCPPGRRPSWLLGGSPGWRGNFLVRFWQPAWKTLVFERVKAIIAAGYDGLYLDRIDVWEDGRLKRPAARAEMIAFVAEIGKFARELKPDIVIVVQNAEELLADDAYVASIDGIAKEDLLHGIDHSFSRNSATDIRLSVGFLNRAAARGRKVLVVEYLRDAAMVQRARREIKALGFVPYVAPRALNAIRTD